MSFPRRSCTEQTKSYTFGSSSSSSDEERSQASDEQSFVAKSRRRSSSSLDSEEERPTSRRPSCRRDLDQSFRHAVSVEPQSSGSPRLRPPPPPTAPPAPTAAPPPADSEEEPPAKRPRSTDVVDSPIEPQSSGSPRPPPPPQPAPAPSSTPPPADSCPICKLKIVNEDGSLQVVVQCVACDAKVHFECSGLQNNSRRSGLKYLCPNHDTSRPDVAAKLSQSELRRIAEIMSKRKAGFCVKCRRENARYSVFWPSLQL